MPINWPILCRFLPDGTVLAPAAVDVAAFYLGVGGIDHPRVFDHHRPGLPPGTTPASLVWERRESLHLTDSAAAAGITLVCHRHPDWNSCWAATLLLDLLAGERPDPTRVAALNTYSAFVLAGHNPVEGALERSPLALFEGLMAEAEEAAADPNQRDERKLREGLSFFRYLYARVTDYASLKGTGLIDEQGPYGTALPRLRADYLAYLRDLQQGRRFTAALAHRGGTTQRVDGLRLRRPVARLFKFWARADRDHSPGRAGFPLLWVQWADDHWIISVDPASGYTLEGLGDVLTAAETRRVPPAAEVPPRPGYNVPDPWFDGRGTPGAFGLVASPRAGTRLATRQVERRLRAFLRVRQWRPAFSRPSPWRDRWLPLAVPVVASLAISLLGWQWAREGPGTCREWRDLPPLEVNAGRHYAIAIGIDDYDAPRWPHLHNPVADARRVLALLIERYGFEPVGPQGSRRLVSGDPVEPPTKQAILNAIQSLATKRLTDQDALVIYYAGHGSMDASFGYWIPQDGHDTAGYIEHSWLQQVLRDSKARHVLVISDSCFSGKLAGREADPFPRPAPTVPAGGVLARLGLDRGTAMRLFSAQRTPAAPNAKQAGLYRWRSRQIIASGYLEEVPDGTGRHSPFASCLIDTLQNNPRDYLSGEALSRALQDCTERSHAPTPKRMGLPETCDGQGDLVLRQRIAGPPASPPGQ